MRAALLLLALGAATAIYPDDHWTFSTELTLRNFDNFVKEGVDAGKTVFAPAWNAITRAFAGNSDVVFGDVNLSKNPVRGNHSPGAGGWPTIKYFNQETGYDGAPYPKKTNKAMCDELGDQDNMRAYVEEMGNTSLCSVETGLGCDEKEAIFIEKWKTKAEPEVNDQLQRLVGMTNTRVKPSLKKWISQRIAILKQLSQAHSNLKQEL